MAANVVDVDTALAPKPTPEAPSAEGIEELTKENYYETLAAAGDALVVMDFFTSWCGPCKVIYPQLVVLKQQLAPKVLFYKLNCNKHNKELGVELKIKVAPTFFLYKNSVKVAEMTGAKVEVLKQLIAAHV